jgi:hypothetical protein
LEARVVVEPKAPRITTADAAHLSQTERLVLALWSDGFEVLAVARQVNLPIRVTRKLLAVASSKLHSYRHREAKGIVWGAGNKFLGGARYAPVEDENCRPVTLRGKPVVADDLTRATASAADQLAY